MTEQAHGTGFAEHFFNINRIFRVIPLAFHCYRHLRPADFQRPFAHLAERSAAQFLFIKWFLAIEYMSKSMFPALVKLTFSLSLRLSLFNSQSCFGIGLISRTPVVVSNLEPKFTKLPESKGELGRRNFCLCSKCFTNKQSDGGCSGDFFGTFQVKDFFFAWVCEFFGVVASRRKYSQAFYYVLCLYLNRSHNQLEQ